MYDNISYKESLMLRKTISIDEHLFAELKNEGVLEHFKNFSDLVSNSLQKTIESMRQENYKKQIEAMAQDPMVLEDIEAIQEDFKYADHENDAF